MQQQIEVAVVVGLGNPGAEYATTRHNVGFRVVDRLARSLGAMLQERTFRASWGAATVEGRQVVLFKPLTFMNRSGEAVSEILSYFAFSAQQMLVIHDDLDLPLGRIRLMQRGGAGGHRGVSSIIEHLGHQDFPRLRLGIGRPVPGEPVESFVLQPPRPDQQQAFQKVIERGALAAQEVLSSGLVSAMNRFNRREPQVEFFLSI